MGARGGGASVQARAGAKLVLGGITATFPLLGLAWADDGYVNRVYTNLLDWARPDRVADRAP